MKKITAFLLLTLVSIVCLAQPKITGHRGCRMDGPFENTIASLKFAQDLGIESVEFDIQLTSDKKIMVFHGPSMPGDKSRNIHNMTFDEARAVVLPGGHQMPTLEEWFAQARKTPDLKLIMEIKRQENRDLDMLITAESMKVVQECGMTAQVDYTSFEEPICDEVLRIDPSAKVLFIAGGMHVPTPEWARSKGYKGLSYNLDGFLNNPGLAEKCYNLGVETTLWIVNNPDLYEWADQHHITYVSTDHPEVLKKHVDRKKGVPGKGYIYHEASEFTLTGKLFHDVPNPYHRVDTARFHGFTRGENFQVRSSSGIAVAFSTDSPSISLMTVYGQKTPQERTSHISAWGYDLYVHEGGKWIYAGAGVCEKAEKADPFTIVGNMKGGPREFLLYLPTYCEVRSVKIGIKEGCSISAVENPFRHRIGVFGSSYTQGSNTSRGGMTWIAQLARETGLEMLSLGCGGNCRLQDYFADVMVAANCEAYIFDAFSNPTPKEIKERLFPFIEKFQTAHPGVPLIFMQTIYREGRNYNTGYQKSEQEKIDTAEEMMAEACKKYKDVYFIHPNATSPDYAATVDGIHPSDHGYRLWMESVKKPILKILKKYGIR